MAYSPAYLASGPDVVHFWRMLEGDSEFPFIAEHDMRKVSAETLESLLEVAWEADTHYGWARFIRSFKGALREGRVTG